MPGRENLLEGEGAPPWLNCVAALHYFQHDDDRKDAIKALKSIAEQRCKAGVVSINGYTMLDERN